MDAGKRIGGLAGIDFQMSNISQGSGPGSVNVVFDPETSDIWNSSGTPAIDSHRNISMGESSQMSIIHETPRSKRQNCGNMQGVRNIFFANSNEGACGSNMVNIESEGASQQVSTCIEYNDLRNHLGRNTSLRHLPSRSEGRYSSEDGLRESHWSTVFPVSEERITAAASGSFAVHNNQPHLNSVPCKRKSSMLDSNSSSLTFRASGGLNSDIARFVAASGPNRPDIGNVAFTEFSSAIPNSMGNDAQYKYDRMNPVYYPQGNMSQTWNGFGPQQNHPATIMPRVSSSSHPSQQWIHRRISANENMVESTGNLDILQAEPSPLSQNVTYVTGIVTAGNGAYNGHGSNDSGLASMSRDVMGNHGRLFRNGIRPAESMLHNTVSRATSILGRTLPIRENASHLPSNPLIYPGFLPSQAQASRYTLGEPSGQRNNGIMPPFPSISSTQNNIIQRPQATYGGAYPSYSSLHGTIVPSAFSGSLESGRGSHLDNLYRMPFRGLQVIPPESINRQHRYSPHDLLNRSQVYNGVDIYDQHSNMRMDVDNMSYEELLALEERIGNVSTGLSEDVIVNCLKMTKYALSEASFPNTSRENEMKCSICQEEYIENDQIGELKCGHGYHTACIRQWLMLKNLCPICKSSAHTGS